MRATTRRLEAAPNPSFSADFGVLGVVEYYGYRYYHTNLGRWLSRDPIKERGGVNLYEFLRNDGLNSQDLWGLAKPGFEPIDHGYGPGVAPPEDRDNGGFTPDRPRDPRPIYPGYYVPNSPTPLDNNTLFTEPGGQTNQTAWFDANYATQVQGAKDAIRNSFNRRIQKACKLGNLLSLNEEVVPGVAANSIWDGFSVGGFIFVVKSGTPVIWFGDEWKWEAEMIVSDMAGFEYGESEIETLFAIFFGWNIGFPTPIERGSWTIKGEGKCLDCGIPKGATQLK